MTTTARLTAAERAARIDALDDFARRSLLHYLAGYAPGAVETALDEMARQDAAAARLDGHAAAQDTEDSHE